MSNQDNQNNDQNNAAYPFPGRHAKVGIHISEQELSESGLKPSTLRHDLMGKEVTGQSGQETDRTLWVGRPSVRKNIIQAIFVIVFALVVWSMAFGFAWRGDLSMTVPLLWINLTYFSVLLVGLACFGVYIWYLFWARRYRVTSERLFLHSNSVFYHRIDEIEMLMVEDVQVEQTFWQRRFGVADISFRTKSSIFRTGKFKDIPDFYRVKEIIREMILMHRQRGNVMMSWQMESS